MSAVARSWGVASNPRTVVLCEWVAGCPVRSECSGIGASGFYRMDKTPPIGLGTDQDGCSGGFRGQCSHALAPVGNVRPLGSSHLAGQRSGHLAAIQMRSKLVDEFEHGFA